MAAMEEDTAADDQAFDLDAFAASYTGHTKVDRLLFLAERAAAAGNAQLELNALRIAHDELRKSENTARYAEVVARIDGRLGLQYVLDSAFVEGVDRRASQKQDRLEAELHNYKTNLIKESIRMGHNDLGDFHYERGDLQSAFKCYVRTRDYCTTPKHIVAMCLSIVRTSLELGNYVHVANYVSKAEQTPDVQTDKLVMSKLRAASGLQLLHNKKYRAAARKFCEVDPDLGSQYADVIAPQDIATYGALAALASLDRNELRDRVVSSITFREFLELVPEVREVVSTFFASQYTACLRALDRLRPTLALDMHLAEHVGPLLAAIRQRALTQYCAPFSSVSLHTMAAAFNTTVSELEKEVAQLIMDKHIMARIDSGAKVLYARHADARAATFATVLAAGEGYVRDTRALLLRAALLQHDFVQKPKKGERSERGGSGGIFERLGAMGDRGMHMPLG